MRKWLCLRAYLYSGDQHEPAEAANDRIRGRSLPEGVAFNRQTTRAYVTNKASDNVLMINVVMYSELVTIDVGDAPTGVKVTHKGLMVVVENSGDVTVSLINVLTNTVIATVPASREPSFLDIL